MRRIVLLFLAAISNTALAEWSEVGATPIFTAYAEPTTIAKNGNVVKMWDAMDFKATQTSAGMQFKSIKSQREFDCKESKIRLLFTRYYSSKMGDGEVVGTSNIVRDWMPVSPESVDSLLWKVACRKA